MLTWTYISVLKIKGKHNFKHFYYIHIVEIATQKGDYSWNCAEFSLKRNEGIRKLDSFCPNKVVRKFTFSNLQPQTFYINAIYLFIYYQTIQWHNRFVSLDASYIHNTCLLVLHEAEMHNSHNLLIVYNTLIYLKHKEKLQFEITHYSSDEQLLASEVSILSIMNIERSWMMSIEMNIKYLSLSASNKNYIKVMNNQSN